MEPKIIEEYCKVVTINDRPKVRLFTNDEGKTKAVRLPSCTIGEYLTILSFLAEKHFVIDG